MNVSRRHGWVLVVAVLMVAAGYLLSFNVATAPTPSSESPCLPRPLCAERILPPRQRLACFIYGAALTPGSKEHRAYVVSRLRTYVSAAVKGQVATGSVVEWVRHKLLYPQEPTVFHFAGDNGVGKTRLAELISLAYGQRCGDEHCTVGDTTLVLSGTGYDGMSVAEFRKAVVPRVALHAAQHPRDGVVILNELGSLEPEKVRVLLPLLGRAAEFPEHPGVHLSNLLVILTTDFGREGRTLGKSLSEMRTFIEGEFKELYSAHAASHIRTLPFLPISVAAARDIARLVVQEAGCAAREPLQLTATDEAVQYIVERAKEQLPVENGRAVAAETKQHVGFLVEQWEDRPGGDKGVRTGAGDEPDDNALPRCTVAVDDEGYFELIC